MAEKIKVLVIEDDFTQALLIKEALDESIYEISNIPDGREALNFLLTQPDKPDLVLMDYHLPNMDGLTIMKKLKEHDKKYNIVFLTADYSIETAIKSINSGALEFIPKDGRFVNNIPTLINKAYQTVKARVEREQFETAYKQSEERYKKVLEASKDGIFEWNAQTKEVHFSQNNAQMLYYPVNEFPENYDDFIRIIHPDDSYILNNIILEHIENNTPLYEAEIRLKTKENKYKWILERGIVVEKDNNGNPLRVIGTHSDISERKAAEEMVLKSNERLTTLISNLPGIVYRYKVQDNIVREFIGGRVEEITGYESYELLNGELVLNDYLVHPEDKTRYQETINSSIKNGSDYEFYYRIITKSGEVRWVWDHGKSLPRKYGQHGTVEGYFADVTEKKINDEALRQSEEERTTILDNSLQAFILLNPKGQILAFNKVANHRNIMGSGKSLKKNNLLPDYYTDIQRNTINEHFNKAKEGEPAYWEQPINIRGEISWYENVMVPVFVSRDEIRYVCFTSTDITERKIAEEKIVYSESLLNTTINSLNDLLFVVDKGLNFLLANDAMIEFNKNNGFETKLIGKTLKQVYPSFREYFIDIYQDIFKTGNIIITENNLFVLGKPNIFEVKITPVFQQGKVIRAVTAIRDITERKNFEKRIMNAIIETEERERKRFSEDLHDEMGSVLSTIKIYINTLHNQQIAIEKKDELIELTNQLIDQAIDNSKIIANNLSPNVIKRFGLVSALQSFCDKLQRSKDITINFNATKFSHSLKEDEEISIYRIIIELINNTLKHAHANVINISFESIENKLIIFYSDDGVGLNFSEAIQTSTKGLGLHNIVSRIASLNGTYSQNHENLGFNFKVELGLSN